ncbi:butyrate--CoA ligase AAE11, peroxisomal-like [Canna indica]|uniref:Butyrate--CoA ligase AAE11, peroxisomal-like n=1 Tax=Canna indica TaxID=4628 RepID=A0AAQ3KVC5_9LILI|nr:butyrate--CoA ligase AAE11, peroxisomal-like [Canna indica]
MCRRSTRCGVPMAGVVLNTINTRLDAGNVANILKHSEAKVFFVDYQCVKLAVEADGRFDLKPIIYFSSFSLSLDVVVYCFAGSSVVHFHFHFK